MSQFKLPKGYKAWCHDCRLPPFNKVTEVEVEREPSLEESQMPTRKVSIPGIGFKTIDELSKHTLEVHRTWKG